jgi:hypothetical protein
MNDLVIYDLAKGQMKTGDMLQWRSNSLLGWAIRLKTQGQRPQYEKDHDINVNHTCMVIRLAEYEGEERRRWTQEALEHGVVLNLLSRRLEQFDGSVYWYRLRPEFNRTAIGQVALSLIGVPYDYGSILKQLIAKVSVDARNLFCSEDYLYCFSFKGKALSPNEMPELGWHLEPVRIL